MSKEGKKGKGLLVQTKTIQSKAEVIEMDPLFRDTTCTLDFRTSSRESMYNLFEEKSPRVVAVKQAIVDTTSTSEDTFSEVANVFVH